jgi:hypothetical protein
MSDLNLMLTGRSNPDNCSYDIMNQNQQKMFSLRPLRLSVFALERFTY